MEQDDYLNYLVTNPQQDLPFSFHNAPPQYTGYFKLRTNVGVIGDIVGYGKTLLALSLIAALPLSSIYQPPLRYYTYHSNVAHMEIIKDNPLVANDTLIRTTVVIVPRGPVYIQWKESIARQTTLKVLSIDNLIQIRRFPQTALEFKAMCEEYDIILIKNTTMVTLLQHYRYVDRHNPITGFSRIMLDEAHTTMLRIPELQYNFLWLITSSYHGLLDHNQSRSICNSFIQLTQDCPERMYYMLIKSKAEFIRASFTLPPPLEKYYVCRMNKQLSAIQSFLSSAVQEKINVNDIAGAIKELGGKEETETDLVAIILREINKDIRNKEKEIEFTTTLDLDPTLKEMRIRTLQADLQRLMTRHDSIQERINEVMHKTCSICYDTIQDPIYLNCSHIFCGQCLFTWVQSNSRTSFGREVTCPECRTPIDKQKAVAIVKDKEASTSTATEENHIPITLTKEEQLIDIISKKPEGRFLLFSRVDTAFGNLALLMRNHNITYCEIKGSTGQMMHILEDFRAGRIKVILLNTNHAGFGIDISCASDVIIYHSMPQEKIQAVGRAQRVGRTEVLTVHNLCYAHEIPGKENSS